MPECDIRAELEARIETYTDMCFKVAELVLAGRIDEANNLAAKTSQSLRGPGLSYGDLLRRDAEAFECGRCCR